MRSLRWAVCRCRRLLIIGAFVLGSSSVLASEPSLGSFLGGAHLVVITGLPGDVENETKYERQLGEFLVIASSVKPAPLSISMFVDSPETIARPEGIPTIVAKASRENVLALGERLSREQAPVVVLAWGHGGTIRDEAVFHVRGPRLSASDFATLSKRIGSTESRWLLFFRGSGRFGELLRGPSRAILASEHEVMFRSDPVGLDLALRVLKSMPQISLESLSTRLGEETFFWYQEQQLARTEEPTYWFERDLARLTAREAEVAFKNLQASVADEGGEQGSSRWIGLDAPTFEIETLDGEILRLADARGKRLVVLNFFATWCGPCKIEMPELVRFTRNHQGDPLLFLGIDARESRSDVEAFRDQYAVNYPLAIDDGSVMDLYEVGSFPTTVVVGLDGRILAYRVGMVRDAEKSLAQFLDDSAIQTAGNADSDIEDPSDDDTSDDDTVETSSENKAGVQASKPGSGTSGSDDGAEPDVAGAVASAGWRDIETVDASHYPGASAVVLERSELYVLGDQPALSHERDEFVQILTEEGEALSDIDLTFSPPGERITFLDLEVRQPGGVVLRLDPGDIREVGGRRTGDYRQPSRKMFSLPGVVPGSVMRLHYRTEWKRFPLPEVTLDIDLAGSIPIRDHRVELRARRNSPVHFVRSDGLASRPEISQSAYADIYRWSFGNVPAIKREALAAPAGAPQLLVSTFDDWSSFNAWYMRLIRDANTVTPEIERVAEQVTKGITEPRKKVEALYNFVTNLRYVAIPLGVNSHRPHSAANVLENRYGDCKDKANLFNTLLETQGIDADLVLVPRFSQAYEETPGLGFNHAISRVRLSDGELDEVIWADTTDEFARFGLLPPGDPGRNVLVIQEGATGLVPLPLPKANEHRLSLNSSLMVDDAEGLRGELELEVTGILDYFLRASTRAGADEGTTRPIVGRQFRLANGQFEQRAFRVSSVAALDERFEWSATGRFSGLVVPLDSDGRRLVQAPFWIPSEWSLALNERTKPLFLNHGYPFSLVEELEIRLPRGATNLVFPDEVSVAHADGPLSYSLAWMSSGEEEVTASLALELVSGELDAADTRVFQNQLRTLLNQLSRGVTYTAPKK